jgi:hypothetical protein
MSFRTRRFAVVIVLELAVDHIGQAAFQAAQRFVVPFPCLALAQVVGAPLAVAAS